MKKQLILTVFVMIFMLNTAFALSVSPAGTNIEGEIGETETFAFTVNSQETYEVSIPDEYSNYIDVEEGVFNETKTFEGQITIPENQDRLKIDVIELRETTGQVTARVSTPHFLFIRQTFEGKMLTYNVRHSQSNHERSGTTTFNVENIGSQTIDETKIKVTINSEETTKTIQNLQPRQLRQIQLETPPTNNGPTTLTYEITYDGEIITNTRNINIGRPNILLHDIDLNYQRDQNNVIRASFTSNWPNTVTQDITMNLQTQAYTVENANLDTTTYEFFYDDSQIPLGNHTLTFSIRNSQVTMDYIKTEDDLILRQRKPREESQRIIYLTLVILAVLALITIILVQKRKVTTKK